MVEAILMVVAVLGFCALTFRPLESLYVAEREASTAQGSPEDEEVRELVRELEKALESGGD